MILLTVCVTSGLALADETELTVEQLVERVKPSVVVVTFSGRDGGQMGLGSGFVLDSEGLIATNLHVIGEARPIMVRTFDGKKYPVVEVHATDRTHDLAILRVDAKGLPELELGDSDALRQGQSVVAFGNPQGLEHSVVQGV
ncbi:MAG: trypsin-like peptidase domain-containing protein, partial [Planctomycetaceae bacterium]